jgi:hypothetical protein
MDELMTTSVVAVGYDAHLSTVEITVMVLTLGQLPNFCKARYPEDTCAFTEDVYALKVPPATSSHTMVHAHKVSMRPTSFQCQLLKALRRRG